MDTIKKKKLNYIIFGVIAVASFMLVFNLSEAYKNVVAEQERSEISTFLMNVKEAELEEFLRENGDVVIYLASSKDNEMIEFEEELIEIIRNNDLVNNFVMMDTDKISNDNFYSSFTSEYGFVEINLTYPNLIVLENHEVRDVLVYGEEKIKIEEVEPFLIYNEVIIEND